MRNIFMGKRGMLNQQFAMLKKAWRLSFLHYDSQVIHSHFSADVQRLPYSTGGSD